MKYRLIFECKHEELYQQLEDFARELLVEYGIAPTGHRKNFKSAREVKIKSTLDGRKSLQGRKSGGQQEIDLDNQ